MTTYSSIRIYISSSASILPNGFYNVVGYYGPSISDSTNPYHIDVALGNFPIVKANGFYYFLTYNEGDGFRPNMVDMANPDNMFIPEVDSKPIYLEQRDDAHMISSYDTPLGANFVIDNIERLYTAYRRVTVDVYDNYAVEHYYEIYDSNHIIDTIEADFILAATNPDGIEIVPREGNVEKLFTFNLLYQKNLDEADVSRLRKIALYDYNTREVVTTVDINTVSYTLGGNTLQFSLRFEVNSPSTYFLYIPSGTFIYEDHISSGMAMFAYSIRGSQGGGSVFEFIYSPTVTRKLQDVKLTFINVMNIPATRLAGSISIEGPNGTESFVCTEDEDDADDKVLFTHSGNEVFLTFPEAYENYTNETVTYAITIPANKISVQQDVWVENALVLYIDVVGEAGSLPTGTDEYSIEVTPQPGVVYGISYINIAVKLAADLSGLVELNEGRTLNEITVAELGNLTNVVDSVANASIKPAYLDENGKQTYEFTCRFSRRNDSLPSYEVTIPSELFAITIYNGDDTQTLYNQSYGLIYTIRPQPSIDEGDTPGSVSFDYKLLTFKAENEVPGNDIAFRPGTSDTIIVNRKYLQRILAKPCLTVTYLDHANGEAVTGKEILAILPGDTISVNIRATYYNKDNVEVSTTSSVEYGYLADTVSSVDLSSVFPVFRTSYPNYFRLNFIFNYNQTEITREIEIQVVPDFIYNKVRENINWNRTLRFDLYTGSQTDKQWGCMYLTNQYDCVLNYKVPGANEGDPEITKYIAELVPTTKVRTGNLSGIYNDTFGTNQPQGYGLYGENVYLTGNFYLNNGKSLVDISDDILMAVGNIREAQDRLNNLDTSVKATIEALTLRQESFENGLDANIKNYISTNKNAVLKIGLDYSIWALGSAGISMINPNASYKFDPISGNYTVDENTVGDGDEFINLQGNKIAVHTYKTEYINAPEDQDVYSSGFYMEVIFTSVNPELWEYDSNGSIYKPKVNGIDVGFARGFVATLPRTTETIALTETSTNILHFVNLSPSTVERSKIFVVGSTQSAQTEELSYIVAENISSYENENETYSFNTYYRDSKNYASVYLKRDDGTLVPWTEIEDFQAIFYVPRVEQAGLFKDGKFNSKYIEAENLVAVDTESFVLNNDGDETILYEKNPRFDPKLPIDKDDNYPVLARTQDHPATQAAFVVISGSTGKITARGADISGTIIVGNKDGQHVKITDNVGEEAESVGESPAIYIKNNKDVILAEFGATAYYSPVESLLGGVNNLSAAIAEGENLQTTVYADLDRNSIYSYRSEHNNYNEYGEPTSEPYYYAQAEYDSRDTNTNQFIDFGTFSIPKNSSRTLKITGGSFEFTGWRPSTWYTSSMYVYASANLYIEVDGTLQFLQSLYVSNLNGKRTVNVNTVGYIVRNDSEEEKIYHFKLKLFGTLNGTVSGEMPEYEIDNWIEELPDSMDSSISVAQKTPITFNLGNFGQTTKVMGNGLLVGYDASNYFATYFSNPAEGDLKMTLAFQAEGFGLKFTGGNMYNIVAGKPIKSYIPILQGKIDRVNNVPCFIGTSLFDDGRSYASERQLKNCQYLPYFSDEVVNHFWPWKQDVDDRGKAVNMNLPRRADPDTEIKENSCFYDDKHKLYIVCDGGMNIILFAPKWDEKLGIGFLGDSVGFLTNDSGKLKTIVQVSGIGKYTELTDRTLPTSGPLYATVTAAIGMNNLQTTHFQYDGTDININNMIQVLTADDASTNPGAFYITVYWCPN